MRALRILTRPWLVAALCGLLVIGLVEAAWSTGASGFAVAASGGLAGVVALPVATQLGLIAGAVLFGLRLRHVVIGALRRIATVRLGRVTVTVRALPVVLSSEIGPWRRPVIVRCWLAGLLSAAAGVGLVVTAWALADGPFARGFAVAVTPFMAHKLFPRRVPLTTSTGWLLFGLPRMPEPRRTEFRAGASAARAHEALQAGDLDGAQAFVDDLAARHPELSTTVSCRVTMLEARGEFARAVALLLDHVSSAELAAREMSYALAGLAGLGFSAVEAGQLPAEDTVPVAGKALHDATALGFPAFELNGTFALRALLDGDAEEAARLAELGAEHATSTTSRADDLATLARAHMARHDNAAARDALARAEALASWWPRVRSVRELLHVG